MLFVNLDGIKRNSCFAFIFNSILRLDFRIHMIYVPITGEDDGDYVVGRVLGTVNVML